MPVTYEPIQTFTATGSEATITFGTGATIPQTYTDLILVCQPSVVSGNDNMRIRVGDSSVDTGSNYSYTVMTGNGSTATSARAANETSFLTDYNGYMGTVAGATAKVINFQNYSNTTTYKTALTRSNRADTGVDAMVGLWRSTAAIKIMTLFINGGATTFKSGSTFTLYGVKAA